jgi:DNA topoisomerase-1
MHGIASNARSRATSIATVADRLVPTASATRGGGHAAPVLLRNRKVAPTTPRKRAQAPEVQHAKAAQLRYVDDTKPGITRELVGNQFRFYAPDGARITDEDDIARIRKLAIPPAYTDVWICPEPNGHLQATGRDARGRKQYRYHARWRHVRDHDKYGRVAAFAERLPKLRARLKRDLARQGLPCEKVLAVAVSVLSHTMIRVGNTEYARTNQSFGLTTLRDRHVEFARGGRAVFKFRGKSGLEHEIALDDPKLAKLVKRCQELPGQHLFQYLDDDGHRQPIDSGMVNDYLRDAMGESFTAKDFRTWGGTLRAIEILASTEHPDPKTDRALAGCMKAAIASVAEHLGNTVAVCKKSYIHPEVFTAWCSGELQKRVTPEIAKSERKLERAAVGLLHAAQKRAKQALKEAVSQAST